MKGFRFKKFGLWIDRDMISFGNYVLSKERRDLLKNSQEIIDDEGEKFTYAESYMERFSKVSHADFENWKELNNKNKSN